MARLQLDVHCDLRKWFGSLLMKKTIKRNNHTSRPRSRDPFLILISVSIKNIKKKNSTKKSYNNTNESCWRAWFCPENKFRLFPATPTHAKVKNSIHEIYKEKCYGFVYSMKMLLLICPISLVNIYFLVNQYISIILGHKL